MSRGEMAVRHIDAACASQCSPGQRGAKRTRGLQGSQDHHPVLDGSVKSAPRLLRHPFP